MLSDSYALLAWSHMSLLYFCVPGLMMNSTMFHGTLWYVLPMTLITLNDIAAYYVGFFFGRTPLIRVSSCAGKSKTCTLGMEFVPLPPTQLSPKKTVEGFVGGGVITVVLGTYIAYLMTTPYLTSSVKVNPLPDVWRHGVGIFEILTTQDPDYIFVPQAYEVRQGIPCPDGKTCLLTASFPIAFRTFLDNGPLRFARSCPESLVQRHRSFWRLFSLWL